MKITWEAGPPLVPDVSGWLVLETGFAGPDKDRRALCALVRPVLGRNLIVKFRPLSGGPNPDEGRFFFDFIERSSQAPRSRAYLLRSSSPGSEAEAEERVVGLAIRFNDGGDLALIKGRWWEDRHPPARLVRLRLKRFDGRVYLDRWGFEVEKLGGVFLHLMTAEDPGLDLHDHPWSFVTIPLWGKGYSEERASIREAPGLAAYAETRDEGLARQASEIFDVPMEMGLRTPRGYLGRVRRLRPRLMRLDECHRITRLLSPKVWTLVIHGPSRRPWGFYLPSGWVNEKEYDETVRKERRDLWNEPTGSKFDTAARNPNSPEVFEPSSFLTYGEESDAS